LRYKPYACFCVLISQAYQALRQAINNPHRIHAPNYGADGGWHDHRRLTGFDCDTRCIFIVEAVSSNNGFRYGKQKKLNGRPGLGTDHLKGGMSDKMH